MKTPEKLIYQPNKTAARFMYLYIIASGFALVLTLRSMKVDLWIGVYSLFNLVVLLIAFLTAVKVKVYDQKYTFIPSLLSLIQLIQLFIRPSGVKSSDMVIVVVSMVIAVLSGILSTVFAFYKLKVRNQVIEELDIQSQELSK